jgi:hypothetical protein
MPILGPGLIIVVVAIAVWVVYGVYRSSLFYGYEEIRSDATAISELLKGDAARIENDLVIAGNHGEFPVTVRFSQSQNRPGMTLRMGVPANFDLLFSPKALTDERGRNSIRTGSQSLDARFTAYTSQAVQAKVFMGEKDAVTHLERLCCSSQTDVTIDSGSLELSEMLIPSSTASHVRDHLESMDALARLLRRMPGADAVKIVPWKRERSWVMRGAIAAGLIVIFVLLFTQPGREHGVISGKPEAAIPEGILPAEASHIPHLEAWRVADKADFSYAAAQFLMDHQLPATGRLRGHFSGPGASADAALLLSNSAGQRRVIIMSGNSPSYDAVYARVDLIAVIPKDSLESVEWLTAPRATADGDGLLVVENADDSSASLVLLKHEKQTYSARPANFTRINLY